VTFGFGVLRRGVPLFRSAEGSKNLLAQKTGEPQVFLSFLGYFFEFRTEN